MANSGRALFGEDYLAWHQFRDYKCMQWKYVDKNVDKTLMFIVIVS